MPLINAGYRINQIASCIKPCNVLFDVGCDHGKLGIHCIQLKLTKKVIFTDISKLNLKKAQDNFKRLKVSSSLVDFVCEDGLPDLVQNIECTVAICGLGAETIKNIISKNKSVNATFVLQPATNEEKLRKYLIENNYMVLCERIIKQSNKFYSIIVAKLNIDKVMYEEKNIYIGFVKQDEKDSVYYNYLKNKLMIAERILAKNMNNMLQCNIKYDIYARLKYMADELKGE